MCAFYAAETLNRCPNIDNNVTKLHTILQNKIKIKQLYKICNGYFITCCNIYKIASQSLIHSWCVFCLELFSSDITHLLI